MILRTRKKSSLYGKCIRGDGKEIKESEIYQGDMSRCPYYRGVRIKRAPRYEVKDACFIDELRQTLSRQENV